MQVVVFNIDGREIPIVHRSIKVHERRDGAKPYHTDILTKVATILSTYTCREFDLLIVHRPIKVHERQGGVKAYHTDILTKVAT